MRAKTFAGSVLSLLLVGSLSGCYGPDQTMMVVHRAPDESLTFTVPICEGGAPKSVMVAAGGVENGAIVYNHPNAEPWSPADLKFTVSDQAVREGHLQDFGMRQDSTWTTTGVRALGDLSWVRVITNKGAVSVDPRVFSTASGTDWVIHGDLHKQDTLGAAVTPEQARAALAEYCG